MKFAYPRLLFLFLPALAALGWAVRMEMGKRASLIFTADVWDQPRSWNLLMARWGSLGLRALALSLVIVGLARPQKVMSRFQGTGKGIDIMMVLDTSLSMNALDFEPGNRMEAAKDTARRFILGRVQDRIGLTVFGGAPLLSCPLTTDYDAVQTRLTEIDAGMTHADGTAIGDGLISGVNHIKDSDAKSKILILLTDGRSNTGLIDPITAAKTAQPYGIKIYTIGTAKRGESIMPVDDPQHGRVMVRITDDLDEESLSEIARIGGGKYFRATNLKELRDIYAEIDRLEKSTVKLPDIVSHADLYRYPVAWACGLLLLELALSSTLFFRWP